MTLGRGLLLVIRVDARAAACGPQQTAVSAAPPPSMAPVVSASVPPAPASASVAPAPPTARSFSLTLASGNPNSFGKSNLWAYVPAAYRADRPLHVVIVFHGFNSCLDSFVGDAGAPCKPWDAPRVAIDLPSQIDKSGTGAIVLVPQLAYDDKTGDPGVLGDGPALEKLAREAIEGPLSDAIGTRKLEDVAHVAMFAISGGYQALYAVLGPDGKGAFGDRLRDVALLDAYYAEEGAVDTWLWKNLAEFSSDAGRPRHLAVLYSGLDSTRGVSQAFAARAAIALQREGMSASMLHRDTARAPIIEELPRLTAIPVLFDVAKHDDIPRADIVAADLRVRHLTFPFGRSRGTPAAMQVDGSLRVQCVNTIKFLAVDGVEKAKSGHPGMPMGNADLTFELFTRHLRYNPHDAKWPNRDRFVLSAGHGSMLLYSMLHLCGYGLSIDD